MDRLKWTLRGLRLAGVIGASVASGGLTLGSLAAEELAEKLLETVAEEGLGQLLDMTVEYIAEEGGAFIIDGAQELLTNEEAVKVLAGNVLEVANPAFQALLYSGIAAGTVSSSALKKLENRERGEEISQLINDQAKQSFDDAVKFVDEAPLSRRVRKKCDAILSKLDRTSGVYKAMGSRWLMSKDVDKFLKEISNAGDALVQDIKATLMKLGIDITSPSPVWQNA